MEFMEVSQSCDLCGYLRFSQIADSHMMECEYCTIQFPIQVPKSGVVTNQWPISPSGRGSLLSRWQARFVQKISEKKLLIDFGCGNGSFLHATSRASHNFQQIMGVEIDELSKEAAIRAGITVINKIPPNTSDTLVTMWHVAEHFSVTDIERILKNLSREKNQLLISVPNGASYSWNKHVEFYSYYDSKSHLVQFTPRSLTTLLGKNNWQIKKEFRSPIYGIFNAIQTGLNLHGPHNELYDYLKRGGNSLTPSILLKTLFSIIRVSGPIFMMILFEFSKKRCSCYTVLCSPRRTQCAS